MVEGGVGGDALSAVKALRLHERKSKKGKIDGDAWGFRSEVAWNDQKCAS